MTSGHDIAATRAALKSHPGSCEGLVRERLASIRQTQPDWHIFITLDEDGALAAARASDARRARGQSLGLLDGIPIAIKDNIDVAGLPTTDGTLQFKNNIAATDSFAVARLRAAGAVILGKLNMHECALGATTDNPFWGRCANPAVPGSTPGGSSGGSAAALAAGFVPLTLGTDTMGSVRIPAAYCGTWAIKPTAGLVSRSGLSLLSWTLDTIGVLAGSADDLMLGLSTIAGHDANDPWSSETAAMPAGAGRHELASITLGVPEELADMALADPVRTGFEQMVAQLTAKGVRIRPVRIQGWDPSAARRAGLLICEAEVSGRLGYLLDQPETGFSDDFRRLVAYGRNASGEKVALAYRQLDLLRRATLRTLKGLDALLMPTAPQTPFEHGTQAPANQADLTALANVAGCPAVAIPLPVVPGAVPQSFQLVGNRHSDFQLIELAKRLASELANQMP